MCVSPYVRSVHVESVGYVMPRIAETFRLTSGDLQAVIDQALADAAAAKEAAARAAARQQIERDARAWVARNRPDHLDVMWSRYRDMVRLVEECPFPVSHPRHGALPLRTVRKSAPFMPTSSPDNHGTERFSW